MPDASNCNTGCQFLCQVAMNCWAKHPSGLLQPLIGHLLNYRPVGENTRDTGPRLHTLVQVPVGRQQTAAWIPGEACPGIIWHSFHGLQTGLF
jgi:hypothetical protein